MDLGLKGKVALVTGGSQGIGLAIARALAQEGGRLSVCARTGTVLEEAAARIRAETGAEVLAVAADLAQGEAIRAVVARTVGAFGRVDILVNNAGSTQRGDFLAFPDEHYWADWNGKLFATIRMSREVFPHMQRQRWGRIVNVVGVAARNPVPTFMTGGTGNAAIVNFTKALADLGAPHNILVTAVHPSTTRTPGTASTAGAPRTTRSSRCPLRTRRIPVIDRQWRFGIDRVPHAVEGKVVSRAAQNRVSNHPFPIDLGGGEDINEAVPIVGGRGFSTGAPSGRRAEIKIVSDMEPASPIVDLHVVTGKSFVVLDANHQNIRIGSRRPLIDQNNQKVLSLRIIRVHHHIGKIEIGGGNDIDVAGLGIFTRRAGDHDFIFSHIGAHPRLGLVGFSIPAPGNHGVEISIFDDNLIDPVSLSQQV
ncbi:MAG: SDR family NAD(P)-dependent oxidoreductase, partial [candidate division NC10 bacterium]|nr:SDR family NAD(P)-dependent oxidoreductase [candidate division NC10 bacterium]